MTGINKIIIILITAVIISFGTATAKTNNNKTPAPATDTTVIKLQEKITYLQEQLKGNKDAIEQLEVELAQRRALQERLTGAISVLQDMLPKEPAKQIKIAK